MGRWRDQLAAQAVQHETTAKTDKTAGLEPVEGGFVSFGSQSAVTADEDLRAAEAEYDALGAQIDALSDQAKAARARGDMAEGELLGAQVCALVVGPYLDARERYAALLNGQEAL